ncbi:hypothetical protein BKA64DRAFT_66663 [Cadophora sp. MPI-SDFR-AT-0126]|nr:hypothetical protein BKA64DRAFT_66663 [Leotiomycetes sp. MPI-SDFR-AT-0126]
MDGHFAFPQQSRSDDHHHHNHHHHHHHKERSRPCATPCHAMPCHALTTRTPAAPPSPLPHPSPCQYPCADQNLPYKKAASPAQPSPALAPRLSIPSTFFRKEYAHACSLLNLTFLERLTNLRLDDVRTHARYLLSFSFSLSQVDRRHSLLALLTPSLPSLRLGSFLIS